MCYIFLAIPFPYLSGKTCPISLQHTPYKIQYRPSFSIFKNQYHVDCKILFCGLWDKILNYVLFEKDIIIKFILYVYLYLHRQSINHSECYHIIPPLVSPKLKKIYRISARIQYNVSNVNMLVFYKFSPGSS